MSISLFLLLYCHIIQYIFAGYNFDGTLFLSISLFLLLCYIVILFAGFYFDGRPFMSIFLIVLGGSDSPELGYT